MEVTRKMAEAALRQYPDDHVYWTLPIGRAIALWCEEHAPDLL